MQIARRKQFDYWFFFLEHLDCMRFNKIQNGIENYIIAKKQKGQHPHAWRLEVLTFH